MPDLSGKKVLVTGADGFIGSRLVSRLASEGAEVAAAAMFASGTRRLPRDSSVCLKQLDVSIESGVNSFFKECPSFDFVFHLAAFTNAEKRMENVDLAWKANFAGTMNLLRASQAAGVRRFVMVGSADEYGFPPSPISENAPLNPQTPYAASKAAASLYCLFFCSAFGLETVILRPFSVYGPGQQSQLFIPSLVLAALAKKPEYKLDCGSRARDFVFVDDVVDAAVRASQSSGASGNVFNIGCGKPRSRREVAETVFSIAGSETRIIEDDCSAARSEFFADSGKARKILGWDASTSLEKGIERTVQWYSDALASFAASKGKLLSNRTN